MFASKNFLDLLREEMKDPSFREGFKDALVEHAIIENINQAKSDAGISYEEFPKRLGLPADKVLRIEDRLSFGDLLSSSMLKHYNKTLGKTMVISFA